MVRENAVDEMEQDFPLSKVDGEVDKDMGEGIGEDNEEAILPANNGDIDPIDTAELTPEYMERSGTCTGLRKLRRHVNNFRNAHEREFNGANVELRSGITFTDVKLRSGRKVS